MKKKVIIIIASLSVLLGLVFGLQGKRSAGPAHRGVYHWKTTYNPSEWEKRWMKDHGIDRLYVKLFDVEAGELAGEPGWLMVPTGTTRFKQMLPKDMEVVPVVYITIDAIRSLEKGWWDKTPRYAHLIVKRIDDMMTSHYKGTVREVQLDCDWTEHTEECYFRLVREVKEQLHERGIVLSGTLRLHQLHEVEQPTESYRGTDYIPFDRCLLMCYNTGHLQKPETKNSILDFNDVAPYLKQYHLDSLPRTDVAYPVYGWGVEFDEEGRFQRLINSKNLPQTKSKQIREEWGEASHICRTQEALPALDDLHTTVLYHLDSLNLSRYSHEDIETFYSR